MPAPPGPPKRYTSVGRGPSAGSRASFSGTVPCAEPERSSGTRSVAHSAPVAARQARQVEAGAAAGSARTAASTARAPRTIRVQTPAIAPPSLPPPSRANRAAGRSAERDALERLVADAGARQPRAIERHGIAVERDRLRPVDPQLTRSPLARPQPRHGGVR